MKFLWHGLTNAAVKSVTPDIKDQDDVTRMASLSSSPETALHIEAVGQLYRELAGFVHFARSC